VARMGEKRNVYRLLVGKPEGNTPLEDDILPSHRRENLKSYITLTGWTL
jgi:hypothetical protein